MHCGFIDQQVTLLCFHNSLIFICLCVSVEQWRWWDNEVAPDEQRRTNGRWSRGWGAYCSGIWERWRVEEQEQVRAAVPCLPPQTFPHSEKLNHAGDRKAFVLSYSGFLLKKMMKMNWWKSMLLRCVREMHISWTIKMNELVLYCISRMQFVHKRLDHSRHTSMRLDKLAA